VYFEKNNIDPTDPYKKGEAILLFLHNNLLKKYVEMETRLDALFNRGIFNCVSSGIIYYALAIRNDLDVKAIRTKDHAFCAIMVDDKIIDVETTTRYGFDPGNKKEFVDSFGKTGFAYTPPSNYRDRYEISAKEILALILQNRIAELQHKGNFIDTVPIAVDRNDLLGTGASFKEMINEFKNHSVQLSNKGDYKKAIVFLSSSASLYDYNPVLTDTASKLFHNQIVRYLDKGETGLAMDFYRYFESDPVILPAMRQDVLNLINQKEIYTFIQKNGFEQSHNKIFEYYDQNLINNSDKINCLVFVYSREITRLSNNNEWKEAITTVRQSIEETEKDPRMVKVEENVKYNIGVVYHNKFANFYNKGDKTSAAAVLEEGLKIIPDSKTLLSDLERLKKQ
jgi:tetratricopeptide (TPR) repeat protein